MTYYFLLILSAALFASQFLLNQLFQKFKGSTAADYVADQGLAQKVAVLYNNGDAYSTGRFSFGSHGELRKL